MLRQKGARSSGRVREAARRGMKGKREVSVREGSANGELRAENCGTGERNRLHCVCFSYVCVSMRVCTCVYT